MTNINQLITIRINKYPKRIPFLDKFFLTEKNMAVLRNRKVTNTDIVRKILPASGLKNMKTSKLRLEITETIKEKSNPKITLPAFCLVSTIYTNISKSLLTLRFS